uniref:inter-alpha-trypsin inhibitor heavy chain H4-like isoform X2 n=1 Tax=Styela clava TaxID=7725 RepID=UPI001939D0A4|nr:inter-alpha-trypsin inhibitor heavy chain H4-like isoform X2 [Styela clava]
MTWSGVQAKVVVLLSLYLVCFANSLSREQSFVIEESDELAREKRHASSYHGPDEPHHSLHVTSVVQSRFARVTFVNKIANTERSAKEVVFSVRLPEAAFITEFDMIVGGVKFVGKIREKKEAKEQYDRAVARGNTAGLVVADVRETQTFDVTANVPAQSSVEFHLVYQQLLKRRLGQYDHTIMVNLKEVIDHFVIDIFITERSGITSISTTYPGEGSGARDKGLRGRDSDDKLRVNTDVRRSKYQAKVTFKPTPTEMRRLITLPEDEQKFTVNYDVTREDLGGEIQTRNGYFVHFFAPEDLPVLPKKVVFVIDRSGSMSGRKISQTKEAFISVIKELRDSDQFNIVSFASSRPTIWSDTEAGLVDVTKANLNDAIAHVNGIRAAGGTDINSALIAASKLLSGVTMDDKVSAMIILLTDGKPTSGITRTSSIRKNIKEKIEGRFSLFCLGFGDDLDHDFLKRMANENDGIARKIYEDSDADLQLEGFFQEVATPLLLNVKMTYLGVNLANISQTDFSKFFRGSEVVVVGAIAPGGGDKTKVVESTIKGTSKDGEVEYNVKSKELDKTFQHWHKETGAFEDFIERLWAYFTIRDLLEKITLSSSRREVYQITSEALRLALKYSFVTPLTSMVVTLPEDEITTTPARPTIIPTIPPCYLRSDIIPRGHLLLRPPIWCPYILSAARDSSSSDSGRDSSSTKTLSGRIIGSSSGGSSVQRIIGGGSSSRTGSIPRSGISGGSGWKRLLPGFTPPLPPRDPPPPPPHIKIWDKCSGKLDDESGTIQLPHEIRKNPYQCEWKIELTENSWMDIKAETLNTTQNKVIVTSQGKTILEHKGGISQLKSVSIQHNTATVLLTVYPKDDRWPGIVISYNQFKPDSPLQPIATPKDSEFALNQSMKNCGDDISSSNSKEGIITSPQYPKMYPDNAYCMWNFANTDSSHKLRLTIIDMDIEMGPGDQCNHDKLVIKNGKNVQQICGYNLPDGITTSEKKISIAFLSDDSLGAGGFKMRYRFVPK